MGERQVRRASYGVGLNRVVAIAETFDSIQGEGAWAGTPMFFIRFAGCNLSCPWCDTDHMATEALRVNQLVRRAMESGRGHVCITGGEPTHQPDALADLVAALHDVQFVIHVETNGTGEVPDSVEWITVSPKGAPLVVCECEEVKVIVQVGDPLPAIEDLPDAHSYYVQPESGQGEEAIAWAVRLVMNAPRSHPWLLGVQTHKLMNLR